MKHFPLYVYVCSFYMLSSDFSITIVCKIS